MFTKKGYSIFAHSRPDNIGTPRLLPLDYLKGRFSKYRQKNPLKYHILSLIFILVIFVSPASAQDFTINSFHSDIAINEDSLVTVKETIDVEFHRPRHGIYREIPFKFTDELGKVTKTPLDVLAVNDGSGRDWKYRITRSGNVINIRIGDAKKYVSGSQTYVITYNAENAILFFDDHDELYWNVTGNYWKSLIKKASANVILTAKDKSKNLWASCYTGIYGSRESRCDFKTYDNSSEFFTKKNLATGEGLTIAFGWDKGLVAPPSSWQRFLWAIDIKENWMFLLPVFSLVFMMNLWYKRGRDPEVRESITVMYEPPKYNNKPLTPAELGTLIDEKLDSRDITATIVGLAVKGHIKIEEVKKEGLILDSTDYYLSKAKDADDNLSGFEKMLMSKLFTDTVCPGIFVSDMKNNFYRHLGLLKTTLYGEITSKEYFLSSPEKVRNYYVAAGIIVIVLISGLLALISPYFSFKVGFAGFLSGIPVLAFSRIMPAKTKTGASVHMNILGFREFLNRAEKDRLERMGDKDLFSKFLPYAIALDVADNWAKAFEGIYQNPPQWYASSGGFRTFSPYRFSNSINSMTSSLGSAMFSTPRGSGVSGSGFGGSGFSGGGFGGGGGGSW